MKIYKITDPDDVKLCNCAECNCELLGESMTNVKIPFKTPPLVWCRILGRPYCKACSNPKPAPLPRKASKDDISPWQENAIKEWENN